MAYSSQESHTGQPDFCNWLADEYNNNSNNNNNNIIINNNNNNNNNPLQNFSLGSGKFIVIFHAKFRHNSTLFSSYNVLIIIFPEELGIYYLTPWFMEPWGSMLH